MSDMHRAQERKLFRQLADGTLTEQEFALLEEQLLKDAEFRKRYVHAMGIEASLHKALIKYQPTLQAGSRKREILRLTWYWQGTILLLTVALFGCGLLLFSMAGRHKQSKELRPDFVVDSQPGQQPVAIVTWVRDIPVGDEVAVKPGTRVRPGWLRLPAGYIQLEFLNGARLGIEGPAELRIQSVNAVTLMSGKAVAHVPPGAEGFVLNTPDAAVVDLGTEFAVAISDSSEVQVLDGAVEVSILGLDGNTLTSRLLKGTDSVRVRRGQMSGLEQNASPNATFPEIQTLTPTPLDVSDAYVQRVLDSAPIIYWRFEEMKEGRVRNEMGSRWNAVVFDESKDKSGIVIEKGMARFTPVPEPFRRIEASEPITGTIQGSYTIELWVNPNHFHWATLAALIPTLGVGEVRPMDPHLTLVELPYQGRLIYSPGSFRFMHRSPPGTNGGINLFTDADCTPGAWHHLVAVKTPTELKFFLNGRLLRHLTHDSIDSTAEAYWLILGCLYREGDGSPDRPLSGALDEVAVYQRPLSDEEIGEHYQAMGE